MDYLGKLQDYYAEHKTLPSFALIAQLLGFKSKNAVTSLVARFKLQGYLEYARTSGSSPGNVFSSGCLRKVRCRPGFRRPPAAINKIRYRSMAI